VQIRRVAPEELDVCLDIFLQANNDLARKRSDLEIHAQDVGWLLPSIAHLRGTDPERLVFAEDGDEPVGFGAAFQREEFWFLSYLEILPAHQGVGVGRALLEFLLPPERARASMTLATVVEAAAPVSTMLYAGYGIVPRVPLYFLNSLRTLDALPALPSTLVALPLSADRHQRAIDVLDRDLLGYARPQDHAQWSRRADRARVYVREDGSLGGYAYLTEEHGWVGPGMAAGEHLAAAIVRDLLEGFRGDLEDVTIPVLGNAASLLPTLLRAGARSQEGAHDLYCSNGRVPPPHYLLQGGFLP
jgi:GNAT superfamily N-acetyltransferase